MLPNLLGLISTDDGACSARWDWALAVENQSAPQPRLLDEKVSGVTLVDWGRVGRLDDIFSHPVEPRANAAISKPFAEGRTEQDQSAISTDIRCVS